MTVYTCDCCFQGIYPGQEFRRSGKKKFHIKPTCHSAKVHSEPAPFVWEGEVKFFSNSRFKFLGSSVRRSREDRVCDYCPRWCKDEGLYEMQSCIYAGQEYLRRVYRVQVGEYWERKYRIWVKFEHYPQCPIPFDDPDKESSKTENLLEMKERPKAGKRPLRRAA